MNYSKISLLIVYIILAVSISLLLVNLLTYKMKRKAIVEGSVNAAYAIWLSSLLMSVSVPVYYAIGLLRSVLDFILRDGWNSQLFVSVATTCALHLGFPLVVFSLWFYLVRLLAVVIFGKRKDLHEIENNNYGYFLVKGIFLFSGIWLLNYVLGLILVSFNSVINMPFYN